VPLARRYGKKGESSRNKMKMKHYLLFGVLVLSLMPSSSRAQNAKALALKSQGDLYLKSGNKAKAEEAYRRALTLDPDYREVSTALTTEYLRRGRWEQAIELLRQWITRAPEATEEWFNLAYAMRKKGELDLAIEAYRHFSKLRPNSPDPYYGLGLIYSQKKEWAQAAQSFRQYALRETNPAKRSWATKALDQAFSCDKKAATQLALKGAAPDEPALVAEPPVPSPTAEKGFSGPDASLTTFTSFAPSPRIKEVKETASKAPAALMASLVTEDSELLQSNIEVIISPPMPQKIRPTSGQRIPRLLKVGIDLAREGKFKEAIRYLHQVVALEPAHLPAYDALAYAYFKFGAYREGAEMIRIGLRDNPEYDRGWLYQAQFYRASGAQDKAVGSYRQFLSHQRHHCGVRFELAQTLGRLHRASLAQKEYQTIIEQAGTPSCPPRFVEAARVALKASGNSLTHSRTVP
jgi:tetratricopeptide (TPR) repeat protein